MTIHKAAGIIIKDRKLLVSRAEGKDIFYSPGGKVELGETPVQALIRELKEEFQIEVAGGELEKFGSFSAPAASKESDLLEMDVFTVEKYKGEIIPDNEIVEIAWVTSQIPQGMQIGSIFGHQVIPLLKLKDLID